MEMLTQRHTRHLNICEEIRNCRKLQEVTSEPTYQYGCEILGFKSRRVLKEQRDGNPEQVSSFTTQNRTAWSKLL
jgi:hypothetical protein